MPSLADKLSLATIATKSTVKKFPGQTPYWVPFPRASQALQTYSQIPWQEGSLFCNLPAGCKEIKLQQPMGQIYTDKNIKSSQPWQVKTAQESSQLMKSWQIQLLQLPEVPNQGRRGALGHGWCINNLCCSKALPAIMCCPLMGPQLGSTSQAAVLLTGVQPSSQWGNGYSTV